MGIEKKVNWSNIFIFVFLVIFPFGQIIRLNFTLFGASIPLLPLDVIAGCGALYAILVKFKKPVYFKYLTNFLAISLFSFVLSCFIFKTSNLIYGLFYLIRISAYSYFLIYIWNFVKKNSKNKNILINSLLGISTISAIFGWIQIIMIPDIKALTVWGWDMHLLRLVGTFLDPTFLGLIIVFGLVLSISRFIDSKNRRLLLVIFFLLISLAFTYSRACYLAFIAAALWIGYKEKLIKQIVLLIAGLSVIIFLLPTARNHSIELFRSFSAIARVDNYKQTLQIIQRFPVFGVGYNNLCIAHNKYIAAEPFSSHACSGSDSSLLMVWATTGIVGLLIFIGSGAYILNLIKNSPEKKMLSVCLIALFVHSIFSNSLFYPWVMGYLLILLASVSRE
jgi:hypothetical protein